MRACDIENDEMFWASERARTMPVRMANLIGESEVLETVLVKKFPVPPLTNNVMWVMFAHHVMRLTSTRCKGNVAWEATTHSGHFNIRLLGQSLHFITPGAFLQSEHSV